MNATTLVNVREYEGRALPPSPPRKATHNMQAGVNGHEGTRSIQLRLFCGCEVCGAQERTRASISPGDSWGWYT